MTTIEANGIRPRPHTETYRRVTRYEVVAALPDGRVVRVGFTSRPSRHTFVGAARASADLLLPYVPADDTVTYTRAQGLRFGLHGPVVRLSGRTEHECASLC